MRKFILFLCLFLVVDIIYSYGQDIKPKIVDTNGSVNAIVQSGDTLYLGGSFSQIGYQTGNAAKLTTSSDIPDHDFPMVSGLVSMIIPDNKGGWYLGGFFSYQVTGQTRKNLAHVLSDGSFDINFNPQPNGSVLKLILSGTTLYVCGSFMNIGGQNRSRVAALSASTGQATGWDPQPNGSVEAMHLVKSTLYVGGDFTYVGGREQKHFAALSTSTGQAIPSFEVNGEVYGLTSDSTSLYIGGLFSKIGYHAGSAAKFNKSSVIPDRDFPELSGKVEVIIPDGNGGWYVGGYFTYHEGWETYEKLAHILSDGTYDTSFNPVPNHGVTDLVLSGNTLYVGGRFTQIDGQNRNYLAALDATTGKATSWNPSLNSHVEKMALSGSTLYVGGNFTQISGQPRSYLAALNTSTGQATNWNPAPNGLVLSMALSNSTLYVGGRFTQMNGQSRSYMAELNLSSGDVTSFDPKPNNVVQELLLSDNMLYVSGFFNSIGGQSRSSLAAVDILTGQATNWNPAPSGIIECMALSGSTLYVGGSFTQIAGQNRQYLAALDASTGLATNWDPEPDDYVYNVAVYNDDVLVGGYPEFYQDQNRPYFAALSLDSGKATSFNPQPDAGVFDMELSGNIIYMSGNFNQIGGQNRPILAALNTSTGEATNFNPQPNRGVYDMVLSGSILYIGGNFTQIAGQNRQYLAALDASTGQIKNWAPEADKSVYTLALNSNDILVGGEFSFMHAQQRQNLAALKVSTGEVLPWDPGANNRVEVLRVDGSTLYVGGSFSQLGGVPRSYIGAVSRFTGETISWSPSANGAVKTLAIDGTTIYVGGSFTWIGGQMRNYLASLSRESNMATSWNPSANNEVFALAVNDSTIFAGGSFSQIGEQERYSLAAFDKSNGNLTFWNPSANGIVESLALDRSLVYAGGSFTQIGGQTRNNIAALSMANGQANSWNPNLSSRVRTITKAQNYVFAGGHFTRAGEQQVNNFTILDAATGVPMGTYPQFNSYVHALHFNPASNTLYTGGQFTMVGNENRGYFASFEFIPKNQLSDQTITLNEIGDKTLADDPLTLIATASSDLPVTFSVVSGPATVSGDQLSFTGTGTVTVRASQAGNENFNPAPDIEQSFEVINAPVATGGILWEYIWNPPATADLPSEGRDILAGLTLNGSRTLTSFSTPRSHGNQYASRARGYVTAPVSGEYIFYLAGDDKAELWLSPDENPSNKSMIASLYSYSSPSQFDKYPSQTSAKVHLVAGQRYYIEALHRENWGDDHLAVGWQMQGGALERPIPGSRLSPYKGGTTTNKAPVASAGPDKNITLPTSSVQLNGVGTDSDGTIGGYNWSQVSGPATATFSSKAVAAPIVSGLVAGTYIFRLTVTDNGGLSASDEVSVQVSAAPNITPTANAGLDKSVIFPANSVSLSGGGTDSDGTIVSYNWIKVSGPSATLSGANTATISAGNLLEGTYIFRLTVTDNGGLTASDEATVTVRPETSTACTASGTILGEHWTGVSGSSIADIPLSSSPTSTSQLTLFEAPSGLGSNYGARVRGYLCPPTTGSYTFWIAADDQAELWLSTDDSPASKVKVASVTSWTNPRQWDKHASQKTAAIRLEAGKRYYIEALHKQSWGGGNLAVAWQLPSGTTEAPIPGSRLSPFGRGTTPPANQPPVANAGPDKSITLPTNSVSLSGSGSDSDGSVSNYNWIKVSGPSATLSGANTATISAGNLLEGTYIFRLTVTDNGGLTASDEATVTVRPATTTACTASGTILREHWTGVSGSSVADIPLSSSPTSTSQLNLFEAPSGLGSNYGARVRGYLCPPTTGSYTFWIAADDQAELWLSTDDSPASKVKVASVTSWTNPRQWDKHASQKTAAIRLEAGKRYYIEALHKQSWGGGNLAVAWQLPNGTMEAPIPGSRLSPYLSSQSASTLVTAGSESEAETPLISYYPNPFTEEVTLQLHGKKQDTYSLKLYDVSGREVWHQEKAEGNKTLRIGKELVTGVYMLQVTTGTEARQYKLVKYR